MTVLLFYYIINCSVDMNNFVLYQHFILSEFNRSWMFSKQVLPIVITLQVLHIIFKLANTEMHICGTTVTAHMAENKRRRAWQKNYFLLFWRLITWIFVTFIQYHFRITCYLWYTCVHVGSFHVKSSKNLPSSLIFVKLWEPIGTHKKRLELKYFRLQPLN